MLSVFSYNQGEYEFKTRISLEQKFYASSLDVFDGRIAVGHDNGTIQVVNTDGSGKQVVNVAHSSGEAWGLEILQDRGTFLTCGDDNKIMEFSIADRKCIK